MTMLTLPDAVHLTDTDYGIALLDERSGNYWNINPTGAIALRTLLDGGTLEQAAQVLVERYQIDLAQAGRDVAELVEGLRSANLVLDDRR